MIPVETIPGMGGRENKGEYWRGQFKYDIFKALLRTFVNGTMYQHNNRKKKARDARKTHLNLNILLFLTPVFIIIFTGDNSS
jgi:hypothetical protein